MRLLSLALAAACALACVAPSQHMPSRFGVVRVAFGTPLDTSPMGPGPWRRDELKELRAELLDLGALGPDFVESDEGAASIVLRPFDSTQESGHKCGAGAARYALGRDYAEVDPACSGGYDELRTAAGHEVGHWLGLPHVCAHYERDASCDPRWRGEALMNPSVSYQLDDGREDAPGANTDAEVATPRPTALDIAEFNATLAARIGHGGAHP